MATAGWYEDPSDTTKQRYWDGTQWTEHGQSPPSASPLEQPPISYVQAADSAGIHLAPLGTKNPIGPGFEEWVRATFSGFFKSIVPTVGLLCILHVPLLFVGYAFAFVAIGELTLRENSFGDPTFEGFRAEAALVGAGAIILSLLLQNAGVVSANHYMYKTQMGLERSFFASLLVCLKALPKVLLFGFGVLILLAVTFGGLIGIAFAVDGGFGVAVMLAFVGFFLFLGFCYLAIRLIYIGLTAAVAPAGENFVRASWRASQGRVWAIFGRIVVTFVAAVSIAMVANILLQLLLALILPLSIGSRGELLVDGSEPDLLTGIEIAELFPSIATAILFIVFALLSQSIQSALFASTTAAMYVQDQDAAKLRC